MDIDCLVLIYKMTFSNQNYSITKLQKFIGLSLYKPPFFIKQRHKYYISMNFKVL